MVIEHFMGASLTNTEHPRAPLLLFKAVDALAVEMRLAGSYDTSEFLVSYRNLHC